VQDAGLVGVVQGGGDLGEDRQGLRRGQGACLAEVLGQGDGGEELHHQVGDRALGVEAEIGDPHDVWMVEPGEGPGLDLEALAGANIAGISGIALPGGMEELDRHRPLEAQVVGSVDHAHAAFRQAAEQPILAVEKGRTDEDLAERRAVVRADQVVVRQAPATERALLHLQILSRVPLPRALSIG
jgi:hypothetical protein